MSVSYSITNKVNWEEVGLGEPDPLTTLEPIIGNKDFSFDVVFTVTDDSTGDPGTIKTISISTSNKVSTLYLYGNNYMNISRNPAVDTFTGEKYRFVDFGSTDQIEYTSGEVATANTDGLCVVGWDTPSEKVITINYNFTITYDTISATNQTETLNLSQDLHWDFQDGFAELQQQVSNSEF